jgi:organic hydroperoxide reductase OsmC/OhrA
MSEHRARVEWANDGAEFSYETYSRAHQWIFPNGVVLEASAAPEYLGGGGRVDPEQAFVAAISSCHMLAFLAIAARKRLVVRSYRDDPVGVLAPNAAGRLAVAAVDLYPEVEFSEEAAPTRETLSKLHESAHRNCFIANSVATEIRVRLSDSKRSA